MANVLVDERPKKSRAVRDSFLTLPGAVSPQQGRALNELRRLLKYTLKEKANA